jgi:hypothetical protein
MRPLPYAAGSLGVFFSQHLLAALVLAAQGVPLAVAADWWFLVIPLRALARYGGASDAVLISALGYLLIAAWALAALAFRRAADADISAWAATLAMAPFIQIVVIAALCALPTRQEDPSPKARADTAAGAHDWSAAVQGLIAGIGATLMAVAAGALLFRTYGYTMFVMSPFLIGAITAYLANRGRDVGVGRTSKLVAAAAVLGAIGLVVAALEGLVCIVLAAPLGIGLAVIGGLLGRAIALHRPGSPQQTLSGLALIALAFALEALLPASTTFDTEARIDISAPAQTVWRHLLDMELMRDPISIPFRLGMAYPLRGQLLGEGVGATRLGEFSTGTAVERVTEWVPARKLAFVTLTDVPAMRELSPYTDVHAPHVIGYFRTINASFELLPDATGGTQVLERTAHELRLEPVLYWLLLARWAVQQNNARVLLHLKRQAERGASER